MEKFIAVLVRDSARGFIRGDRDFGKKLVTAFEEINEAGYSLPRPIVAEDARGGICSQAAYVMGSFYQPGNVRFSFGNNTFSLTVRAGPTHSWRRRRPVR